MKKVLLALACLALPLFMFTSCDDDEDILGDLTGNVTMTIGSTNQSFTGAAAYQNDGKTIIATTDGSEAFTLTLDGTTAKKYVLGFAESLNPVEILASGLNTSNFSSTLTYVPKNSSDTYEVIAGSCTVSSVSSTYIKGTFTGYAVKVADLSNLSTDILTGATKISGSFTGVLTNSFLSK